MIDFVEIKGWLTAAGNIRQNGRIVVVKGCSWLASAVMALPMLLWTTVLVYARYPATIVISGLCVAIAFGAGDFSRHARDGAEIVRLKRELGSAREALATSRETLVSEKATRDARISDLEGQVRRFEASQAPASVVAPVAPSKPAPRPARAAPKAETVSAPKKTWSPF